MLSVFVYKTTLSLKVREEVGIPNPNSDIYVYI